MHNRSDYTVHLHRDGVLHSFAPGQHLPDWARELIGNRLVLGEDTARAEPLPVASAPGPAADATEESGDEPAVGETVEGRPPEAGPAASRAVWEAYATGRGITVDSDWKREDIIGACTAAGF